MFEKTLTGFLDDVGAKTSAPGGGAVAAVAVSLAAALVEMAAEFSGKQWEGAADAAARARELRTRAMPLAEADAEAYGAVIAATRGTPDYDEALSRAADVPVAIAQAAADVAELAAELAACGNPNLRGDASTSALLAEAAARAAANLVEINLAEKGGDERIARARELASSAGAAAKRALAPPS